MVAARSSRAFSRNDHSLGRPVAALLLALLFLVGCSPRANQNLFQGTACQEAVKKILEKAKGRSRALNVEIKTDKLIIQLQDPAAPTHIDEFSYRKLPGVLGMFLPEVSGPTAVRLNLINPNLEENLFDLDQVNFAAVPEAVAAAVRRVALDGGGTVDAITIQRKIRILPAPSSGDIEWHVDVHGPRESATAYADAQGRITHLDLSGTQRAKTLDYTRDPVMLTEAIGRIRSSFGSEAIYNHFTVSRLNVAFTVRDEKDPKATQDYSCDISAIRQSVLDKMFKIPKDPFAQERDYFSIDDADWSKVASIGKVALEKIVVPNAQIFNVELIKPGPKLLKPQKLRWRVRILEGSFGESGYAEFDPKSGELTAVELPPSQVKAVNFLEPAQTSTLLSKIREDFTAGAPFMEISVDDRGATVKATSAAKPDELESYSYDAKKRAEPTWSHSPGFPKSPFDLNFDQHDLFSAAEFQAFEPRVADLEKKTLERLPIADAKVTRLTWFRKSPFYPRNKKVLLEVRTEGRQGRSGRVVWDSSGSIVDVVRP
jgi:hypothetical protein